MDVCLVQDLGQVLVGDHLCLPVESLFGLDMFQFVYERVKRTLFQCTSYLKDNVKDQFVFTTYVRQKIGVVPLNHVSVGHVDHEVVVMEEFCEAGDRQALEADNPLLDDLVVLETL